MILKLIRLTKDKNNRQKLGRLMLFDAWDCKFWCHILEPFDNFPAGRYNLKKYDSPKFGKVLLYNILDDKGNQRYFEIHAGNFRSDTRGCQLPGDKVMKINDDDLYDVANSKATLDRLLSMLPDEIYIDVFENPAEFNV